MTFLTDAVKMGYPEDEIFAVLHESEQDRKRRHILAKVTETVKVYRLREMKDLQAREKLATWRRMNGSNRVADGGHNWFHGPRLLPPTPETFAASLWSEVNALKDATSMPARTRPWQKTMEFVDGLKGKLLDEELAVIKRYVEKRSREAAQVTVTPVSTSQHCIPRPLNPEIPSDVHVNMEEKDKDWMNPERDELESSSAGTGIETPGQQCPPNEGTWEKGRTIANGYLLVGMGSNQGGDISSPTERVDMRAGTKFTTTSAASNTVYRRTRSKPQDKKTFSEENKPFDPGGEGGEQPPPWNAAVMVAFSFPGGNAGSGVPVVCTLCSFSACLPVCCVFTSYFQVITFQRAENMRGDADHVADARNRRASIFLPINPSNIITTVSGSMHRMPSE